MIAHVGGLPIEETLGSLGPALLLAYGAVSATLRARHRRVRSAVGPHAARARRGRSAGGPGWTATVTTRAWTCRNARAELTTAEDQRRAWFRSVIGARTPLVASVPVAEPETPLGTRSRRLAARDRRLCSSTIGAQVAATG